MVRKILILALAILTSFSYAQIGSETLKPNLGKKLGVCNVCGMEVFEKMMTRVEILIDDSIYHACGIGCALTLMEGKNVKSVKVIDFKTFKLVDAKNSYFVVGSVILPARAMLLEFSFAKRSDANDFVKLYGGQVLDYNGMIELARKVKEERMKK